MSRLNPGVARTVAVLNFFADHASQAFTLTDVLRALKLSRATGHSLLGALAEEGYLYRNPDKSYTLGPALIRVGAAARAGLNPLQAAMPEMRRLADELDVVCSAVFREGDNAVVRERASSMSHLGWAAQVARTVPLDPPFGIVFMAWDTPERIDRWLARIGDDAAMRDRVRAGLDFPRRHGFSPGLRTEHLRGDAHARSLAHRVDKTDYLVNSLDAGATYDLAFVTAPVFDASGDVAFALGLMGFTRPVGGAQVVEIGTRLRQSCDRVSHMIGGRIPAPD